MLFNCAARPPHLEDAQAAPVRRGVCSTVDTPAPRLPLPPLRMLRSAKGEGRWGRGAGWKPEGTDVQMIGPQRPWAMDCEPPVPALWASQAPQGPPSSRKALLVVPGQSSTPAPLQDLKRGKNGTERNLLRKGASLRNEMFTKSVCSAGGVVCVSQSREDAFSESKFIPENLQQRKPRRMLTHSET